MSVPAGLPEGLGALEGIDLAKGLVNMANMPSIYLKILRNFVKMITNDGDKLANFLSGNDIENFTILVHGYKSALASIGVDGLSIQARDLEMAGKGGDRAFIDVNFPAFFSGLKDFTVKLDAIVNAQ